MPRAPDRRARYASAFGVLAPLATIIAICLASSADAGSHFVVALPNGYYMERDPEDLVRIVTRGGQVIVAPPIAAYAVHRYIVAGAHGPEAPSGAGYVNATPYQGTTESRYFVLDAQSGELDLQLTPAEWRAQLTQHGVPPSFEITAPVLPKSVAPPAHRAAPVHGSTASTQEVCRVDTRKPRISRGIPIPATPARRGQRIQ